MINLAVTQPEYQTIVLKRIGRRHKRLKIVLKWLVFIMTKPYNKTVAEVSCLRSNQRILSDLVLQRPETSATVDYKNYRFTIFFALPSE